MMEMYVKILNYKQQNEGLNVKRIIAFIDAAFTDNDNDDK